MHEKVYSNLDYSVKVRLYHSTPFLLSAVGDLKQFSSVQDHHVAKHGFDCSFFTPDQRPHCIKSRYSLCDVTPVGALRGADLFRKDGLHSSNLFKLWPIVLKDHQIKTPDLNAPRKQVSTETLPD